MAVKLYYISRFFFFVIICTQGGILTKYLVDHEENGYRYLGFLAVAFLMPLAVWAKALCETKLKYRLGYVWFFYMVALVAVVGVIFGRAVIEHKKLREEGIHTCICNETSHQSKTFFDAKFLKMTLCLTPGQMLLLLTSVTDGTGLLKELYLTVVLDLFDGVEMLEVLHEDVCNKIPQGWQIAVLVASCLFFLLSSLEIYQIKFKKNKDDSKLRKKTVLFNTVFQISLNLAFLVVRAVLWMKYDFNSTVFLAKNVISLAIITVQVLEVNGCITTQENTPIQRGIGLNNLLR